MAWDGFIEGKTVSAIADGAVDALPGPREDR